MSHLTTFIAENWLLSSIALALLLGLIYIEYRDHGTSNQGLNPQQATMMMNRKNMLIIDLRDLTQFDAGHILNAKPYTIESLQAESEKLSKNKDKPMLIYSSTLQQSAKAVSLLKQKGFTEVYHLIGGLTAWQKEGLPLVKSTTVEVNHG